MLGFNPIAATPLDDISIGQLVSISGQTVVTSQNALAAAASANTALAGFTLTLSQESLSIAADANTTLTGQTVVASQNGVSITAAAAYTLNSQTLSFTQNNFSITADSVYLLLKQVDMVLSVNSVDLGVYINLDVTGQTITSTLNSVDPYPITYVPLVAQTPLQLSQHSTHERVSFRAPSQTIHTALHSMRMWNKISTSQVANWTPIDTTQSPGWTEIET